MPLYLYWVQISILIHTGQDVSNIFSDTNDSYNDIVDNVKNIK